MAEREIPKPNIVTVLEHLGGRVLGPDRGGWRKAICPIHDDKTPSASVHEEECRFSCFTCDFSGDAIDLIQEVQGVGWSSAAEVAAGLLGEGVGGVPEQRGGSSLLPGGSRNRPKRGTYRAPWLGL